MSTIEDRIESLDVTLFGPIPSETSREDRHSLLSVQKSLRHRKEYVYLEIGSHLGGSLQVHFADPKCRLIYSIDKRPASQPDERGIDYPYPENSTRRMITRLQSAYPAVAIEKVRTFDCDASEVSTAEIVEKPDLCFIDGEHTNDAVFSDFRSCLGISGREAAILFHDSGLIYRGIRDIKKLLTREGIRFEGVKLEGSVYLILLNDAIRQFGGDLENLRKDEAAFWRQARRDLWKEKWKNRIRAVPPLRSMLEKLGAIH